MLADSESFELKNDLSEIVRLAKIVEDFANRYNLSQALALKLNLALEEIITNIISYGFPDGGAHTISLRLGIDGGNLTARIEDGGIPYNPLQAPVPNIEAPLEQRPVGGLGVHLVRQLMDDVAYSREDGKNVLSARKKIEQARHSTS